MGGTHSGHRERLRTRAVREGLESFQPHEVLELLLTQAIPQRDVNPLAHSLIDAFGSVDGALGATVEELCRVPGVGERTAKWLRAMGELTEAYAAHDPAPAGEIQNFAQAAAHLEKRRFAGREAHLLLCMGGSGRLLHTAALEAGPGGFPGVREAVATALRCRASSVCSAHVLAAGSAMRAEEEKRYARHLSEALALIDIGHMDHILVSGGRAVSLQRASSFADDREEALAAERPFAAPESPRRGRK